MQKSTSIGPLPTPMPGRDSLCHRPRDRFHCNSRCYCERAEGVDKEGYEHPVHSFYLHPEVAFGSFEVQECEHEYYSNSCQRQIQICKRRKVSMVIRSTERLTLTKEPSPIVFCENAANRRSDCRSDGPDTKQDMIYEFSTNQDYGPVPDKTYAPNMPLFHDQT